MILIIPAIINSISVEGDCCQVEGSPYLGDGICHGHYYNTVGCGYDRGDCVSLHDQYPYCPDFFNDSMNYTHLVVLGDGICDFIPEYMTEECGYGFGDCVDCQVEDPDRLGDGKCDDAHNTAACGYDNGDCI